ncbi:MAG: DUF362 domain-containing protein [Dehalococcoidia bacterium]|nr:Electron transport complex subunit RsxB [Chloroflexota bacterium]MBT9160179.1 Electron transport complex subunit RsxB [Chloroflexota bacterium]MBT9162171.1 Electron transport complex subunit RsxB [Chloroflexota bacterium]MBT9163111.1 Electron transport complex subunit RsxB [Chloroflexota bacterium]
MKTKVSIVGCVDYDIGRVKEAVRKAVSLIGGWEGVVDRGNRVLVKPNMLSARPPEDGVTTHPAVVRAVVELVQEAGAEVLIGDSPGGTDRDLIHCWEACGYSEVSKVTGAPLISLDREILEVEVPRGVIYKTLHLSRTVLEVDSLITVPKLKTHNLTLLTGAVKNLLGLIPGGGKIEFHRRCPRPDDLGEAIVDILSVARPKLALMDAVVGMEGDGPVSDQLRDIGVILASRDSVALDTVAQAMIGLKPFDVPTTRAAAERKLGTADLREMELVGRSLGEAEIKDFILPSNAMVRRIPRPILALIARRIMVRPRARADKCTNCSLCMSNCPVDAIYTKEKSVRVDYKKCILCLCCYELCPEKAMDLRKSLLTRFWR